MTWDGDRYQRRFDDLAASGVDVHGEADFIERFHPASVLDAGCGTGRVARELARRGIEVLGVDVDTSMIDTARRLAPELNWVVADLSTLETNRRFDLVVMAGNVLLFTPEGTQADLVRSCARHIAEGGHMVAGFGLDRGYDLTEYDRHCHQAGLALEGRWATWEGEPWTGSGTYAVSVHRPVATTADSNASA
ncbi:MAG TPA: class I SAM-dependent methyltransferase [Acidimicrobiales bacterium]|nr:class I SAM-dependent methyltransferase [Acidimicrobiales bacterium]